MSKAAIRAEAEQLAAAWRDAGGQPSTERLWCSRCEAWSTVLAAEPLPFCQWCKRRVAASACGG